MPYPVGRMKDLEEEVARLARTLAEKIMRAVIDFHLASLASDETVAPGGGRRKRRQRIPGRRIVALKKPTTRRVPSPTERAVIEQAVELLRAGPMLSRDLQQHFLADRLAYLHAMYIAVARGRVVRTMTAEGKVYSLPSEDAS